MFDDLLSSANEQQKQMDEKLAKIQIVKESNDKSISLTINAKKEVQDISINRKFDDLSELEDILVITLNEAMSEADEIASSEANDLLQSMLPGGLGGLFG